MGGQRMRNLCLLILVAVSILLICPIVETANAQSNLDSLTGRINKNNTNVPRTSASAIIQKQAPNSKAMTPTTSLMPMPASISSSEKAFNDYIEKPVEVRAKTKQAVLGSAKEEFTQGRLSASEYAYRIAATGNFPQGVKIVGKARQSASYVSLEKDANNANVDYFRVYLQAYENGKPTLWQQDVAVDKKTGLWKLKSQATRYSGRAKLPWERDPSREVNRGMH